MATAKHVLACENSPQMAWVEIEDENGSVWKYLRKSDAPANSQIHARADMGTGKCLLERDATGMPYLQQVGAGLPPKMVMYFQTTPPQFAGAFAASWGGTMIEYEQ